MASRIPALPQESHVQSHATVHKNKLCDSHSSRERLQVAGLDPLLTMTADSFRAGQLSVPPI
jgi:hypothetical protein